MFSSRPTSRHRPDSLSAEPIQPAESTTPASATRRPRVFLTARWEWLLMVNFEVDPALLRAFVPRGTELDFFAGRTYVSLVGFLFRDTRLRGWSIPGHRQFEELNLRFYVRREEAGQLRRGVVFIKELVPRWAVAAVARWRYNENYACCPMGHGFTGDMPGIFDTPETRSTARLRYWWKWQGATQQIAASLCGVAQPALPGSEEEFITEHYWGYTRQRDGGTLEYRVDHPSWRLWTTSAVDVQLDAASLYGRQWTNVLSAVPTSALVADGSPVSVHPGRRLVTK